MGAKQGSQDKKISPSATRFEPKTPAQEEGPSSRAKSHSHASPSPRCGFGWVRAVVEERLAKWNIEDANECYDCTLNDLTANTFGHKYFDVERGVLPHLIGKGGRLIHGIEDICGVFVSVVDLSDGDAELLFSGTRFGCVLAEFICQMIVAGHRSILSVLLRHGF